MCGRYTITGDLDRYVAYFGVEEVRGESLEPNFNVAPTDPVYAVVRAEDRLRLGTLRWGLRPFSGKGSHINARAETIATKAVFRDSFLHRRCLIPADGFYEWEQREKGKLPHYIRMRSGDPMGFAGIWARGRHPDTGASISTCAIITTRADEVVRPLHDRMPVILNPTSWQAWLDPAVNDPEELEAMLSAASVGLMAYPVSSLVNSVRNNLPELIVPLTGSS